MQYFLALGTNIGNLQSNIDTALEHIKQMPETSITKQSNIYKTKPWGVTDQPDFLNMVIEIECGHAPEVLWTYIEKIEQMMGRTKTRKWGERIIDIDILFCDDKIYETENIVIPHPLIPERDFVLTPLKEIAPEYIHPILGKKIKEIQCQK